MRSASIKGRKTFWFRLISLLLGLAVGAAAAEMILRYVAPPRDTEGVALPGSPRQYGYPANFAGYAGGVHFTTNSSGFRGRELLEKKAAKDFVLVIVGDSYAFGYGVEYANSFPAIIERELLSSGTPVKVFVLAVPGYNTAQELATLQEFAPRLHPDLVLLSYHLNDIERHAAGNEDSRTLLRSWNLRKHFLLARLLFPQLARVARWLRLPVKTTATAEVEEYVENGKAWQRNQSTLNEFIAFTQGVQARLAVVVVPYLVSLNDDHPDLPAYEVVTRFFRSKGVPVTDAFRYVKGVESQKLWINRFDGHPNEVGHRYIAKAALDLIRDNQLVRPVYTEH